MTLDEALEVVKAAGYVVLKEKSYRAAQRRQDVAEARLGYAEEERERYREWASDCHREECRLRDRLTFVYGVAQKMGATREDLSGCVEWANESVQDEVASTTTTSSGNRTKLGEQRERE